MDIQKIKRIMKERKMTQQDLSDQANVPLQTIRYIFTGRTKHPRIDTVRAIEKVLDLNDQSQNILSAKEQEIVDLLMQFDEKQLDDVLSVIKIIAKK